MFPVSFRISMDRLTKRSNFLPSGAGWMHRTTHSIFILRKVIKMKRLLTLALAFAMTLSLSACGGGDDTDKNKEKEVDSGSGTQVEIPATIVCVTTKDSPYASAKSIADLSGGKCTAQSGTIWYDSCLPQIKDAKLNPPADNAPAMLMSLTTGEVDFVCTDMPTAMGACAKNDNLVILNFSGTDGDFQFATEEERAENVNIGIAVQKGNTALKDAMDAVLSTMTEEDFNTIMDQAISVQPWTSSAPICPPQWVPAQRTTTW